MSEPTIDELIEQLHGAIVYLAIHQYDTWKLGAIKLVLERERELRWRPTSEEPESGAIVLCHSGELESVVVGHLNQGIWCSQSGHVLTDVPLFWLPLSALPPIPIVEER